MGSLITMSKQELQVKLLDTMEELEASKKENYSLLSQLTSYQDNHTRRENEIESSNKQDKEYIHQLEQLIIKTAIKEDK